MVKVTVAGIIIKNGRILLEKRRTKPFKNYWCLPGGHVEKYETAERAIKREVEEETGLKVTKAKFLFYQDEILPRIKWHAVVLVFLCKTKGKIKIDEKEVSEVKWFKIKDSLKLKLAFKHKEIIKRFLKLYTLQEL